MQLKKLYNYWVDNYMYKKFIKIAKTFNHHHNQLFQEEAGCV